MGNEIEFVRECARKGHSFSRTASLLGFWPVQLRDLLEVVGVTDIEFVNGHQSLARKKALADLHESRRGKPVKQNPENLIWLKKGTAASKAKRDHYTAFGVTGTIPDLMKLFNSPVHSNSVRKRLRNGMDIETALTLPAQHLTGSPDHPSNVAIRARARGRRQDAIARRLKPSMLQFWSSSHDIIIVKRQVPYVTVVVREKSRGKVLHRLRFVAEFSSGVLFEFSQEHRQRMDFIAFEPGHPAVIQ